MVIEREGRSKRQERVKREINMKTLVVTRGVTPWLFMGYDGL
jgi:hypothetical protein